MRLLPSLKGSAEKMVPKRVAQGSQILGAFSQIIPKRKPFFSLDSQQYSNRQRDELYSTKNTSKKTLVSAVVSTSSRFAMRMSSLRGWKYTDLPDHAFDCRVTAVCSANTLIPWCCIIGKLKVCLGKMASA
jgi:hypothetical protein